MLEAESQVGPLAGRGFNHRRHSTGLLKNPVQRVRDTAQTLLLGNFVQMGTGMKIQHCKAKLFATLHLIEKSLLRHLQLCIVRRAQVNQKTVMRQDEFRKKAQLLAIAPERLGIRPGNLL